MWWFQLLLIAALLAIAIYLLRSTPSPRELAVRRILMLLGLAAGVVVIIWPELLTVIARWAGIGRGADLLFYAAIVVGLLFAVSEHKRGVELARANTQLARDIALTEARLSDRIAELEARRDAP